MAGQWRYVYRAIEQFGQVIDVFVSACRDAKAACRVFQRAIGTMRVAPVEVVTDHAPVYPAVLEKRCIHRSLQGRTTLNTLPKPHEPKPDSGTSQLAAGYFY